MRRSLAAKCVAVLALALCAICIASPRASAESVEEFYKGKTLTMVVGYPPGGANDIYARLVAKYIGKYIPGKPGVITKNMPGAGSVLAANFLFNGAPKDGLTLGLLVPTLPLEEALGSSAARFKSAEFNWIGRLAPAPNATFINNTSEVKNIKDAFQKVALLGATGSSATNAIYPMVLNAVVGTKFKVVQGYKGSAEVILAMERGEVEGHSSTYDTLKSLRPEWIKDRTVNIVVQYTLERQPEMLDVPTAAELGRNEEERQILRSVSSAAEIGKFVLTTPGVPADRVEALRRAFDQMGKDPEFVADAAAQRVELGILPGAKLQQIVSDVVNLPPGILEKVKAIYPLN